MTFFTVVCNNLMITFGQFVAGCVCGAFSGINPNGWKWMLGLAGVPSAVSFHNQIIGSAKKLYIYLSTYFSFHEKCLEVLMLQMLWV